MVQLYLLEAMVLIKLLSCNCLHFEANTSSMIQKDPKDRAVYFER